MSDTEQDPLTSRLAYLARTMDDDDRPTLSDMLKTARAYLAPHIAGYTLAQPLLDDVVLGISLDLWQAKDARNGIVALTVDGVEPFRISTDPMRSAWPKLRAAGIPAGMGGVMSDYDNTVAELTEKLTGLGGIVTQVTDDPTLVKPSTGKASIWIEPPGFTWEGWHPYPPEITIKLMVTAGTPTTQQKAIPLIMQVLELMHQENLPLRSATASGFNLADAGTLAAYEVTLNAI